VRIEGNHAYAAGGGVYLKPAVFNFTSSTVNFVSLTASGYRIDDNWGVEGSAFYVDTDTAVGMDYYGGTVTLNPASCLPGIECDVIDNNINKDKAGNRTAGSTVLVQTSGNFRATGVRMHDNNVAAHLIRDVGSQSTAFVTCLLYGNGTDDPSHPDHISDSLIEVGTSVTIEQCTIASNLFDGTDVIHGGGYMQLENSLVDQPGKGAYGGSQIYARYIVATDVAGLPSDPTIEQQQPLFINAAGNDFRLRVGVAGNGSLFASQGVDFAKKDRLNPPQHAFARIARRILGEKLDLAAVEWGYEVAE